MSNKAIDDDEVLLDFTSMEDSINSLGDDKEVKTKLFLEEDIENTTEFSIEIKDDKVDHLECQAVQYPPRSSTMNKKLCEAVIKDVECQHTKKGLVCNYAHSVKELVPDTCKHGKNCYRVTFTERYGFENKGYILCRLIHEGESFDNYIWRIGYEKYDNIHIPKFNPTTKSSLSATSPSGSTSSLERKRCREEPKSLSRPMKKSKYLPKKDLKKEYPEVKRDKKDTYNSKDNYNPVKKPIQNSAKKLVSSESYSNPTTVTLTVPASHYKEAIIIALEKGINHVRIRIEDENEI
jgi:hypothetical protein